MKTTNCFEPSKRIDRNITTPTIKAAILDFSGTTCDPFVIAPAAAFFETFKKNKVPITWEEARKPMGLRKDLHIEKILKMPRVAKEWNKTHGNITNNTLNSLFSDFTKIQNEILVKNSAIIADVPEVIQELKNQNIKIGCTTGFTNEHAKILYDHLEQNGCKLDCFVAGDMVQNGVRPNPFMLFKNMELLDVPSVDSVVKCDDTVGGIGEGLNAGTWTVGIAKWSNYMNINSMQEYHNLDDYSLNKKISHSRKVLLESGPDFVIDDISNLPYVIKLINNKLANNTKK
jgi:phosphonoacetaldehyde hydrolase